MTAAPPLLDGDDVVVHRARLVTRRSPETGGQRVERILQSLRVRYTGLPQSAVLIVRSARVVALPADWGPLEAESDLDLRATAARAARPALGAVASGADAVVFLDEVELITAFTRDVLAGAALPWWWRGIIRRFQGSARATPPSDLPRLAWHAWSRALPGALSADPTLVTRGALLLRDKDALGVLAVMARAHGAAPVAAAARAFADETDTRRAAVAAATGRVPVSSIMLDAPPVPPWRPWSEGVVGATAMTPAVEALLGTAIALARRPAAVRSPIYAQAAARWLRAEPAEMSLRPSAPPREARPDPSRPAPGPRESVADPGARARADRSDDLPVALSRSTSAAATPPVGPQRSADQASPRRRDTLAPSNAGATPRSAAPAANAEREAQANTPEPRSAAAFDVDVFRTNVGGVFFLLGVLEALDLPATASAPDEPGGELTRWAILELLGRSLTGGGNDEIWSALAILDCREPGDPIAYGGADAPTLRMASEWAAFAAGAAIDDAPTRDESAAVIPGVPAVLQDWTRQLATVVRSGLERRGLALTFLAAPAVIEIGAMFVVVEFPATSVEVTVRRLGLDRDPGWVAELGRVIEYRFT